MRLTKAVLNTPKLLGSIGLAMLIYSSCALAEDFYRWVDESGVVHYGSMPPQGVDAVKIKSHGKAREKFSQTNDQESAQPPGEADLPPEEVERRRKVAAKMKEDCKNEKARLNALNNPGRIRMQQDDGSYRYLSQDEIYTEIQTTKNRIKETCQ